jgi:hypothetical protein
VLLGGPDDYGRDFDILAVVATKPASTEFHRYFEEDSASLLGLPWLPAGTTVADRITVTRR